MRDFCSRIGVRYAGLMGFSIALLLAGIREEALASGRWTPINLPTAQGGRMAAPVVFDSGHSRFIAFGGYGGGSYHNDVFVLSTPGPSKWTPLSVTGAPPPSRFDAAMIYDPTGDRVILYGGNNGSTIFSDVWQLSLSGVPTWSLVTPGGGTPGNRTASGAVYDPIRHQMVVFGGRYSTGFDRLGDVWALSLIGPATWTQILSSGSAPDPRSDPAFVYDSAEDAFILFGGSLGGSLYAGDCWRLSLTPSPSWTLVPPSGPAPSVRFAAGATYDPVRDRVMIFGGYPGTAGSSSFLNDLWALDPLAGVWTTFAAPPTHLTPRDFAALVYDPLTSGFRLISGNNVAGQPAESWQIGLDASGSTASWSMLEGSIGPHDRAAMPAAFDLDRGRGFSFGGYGPNGGFHGEHDDSWNWPNPGSNLWDPVATMFNAPAQTSGSVVYDQSHDRMVTVDGGVWQLFRNLPPTWSQLTSSVPGGYSIGTSDTPICYDPVREQMVVFGGEYSTFPRPYTNEVWTYDLNGSNGWTQVLPNLSSPTTPAPRIQHAMVYDPDDDGFIVTGGQGTRGWIGDTWLLQLSPSPHWTQLSGATGPDARVGPALWYDGIRHQAVLFGGRNVSFLEENDTWALTRTGWSWAPVSAPTPVPPGRSYSSAIYDPTADRFLLAAGWTTGGQVLSDLWQFTFDDGPTATLADVIQSRVEDGHAILGWQLGGGSSSSAVGLERRVDAGAWIGIATLTPDGTGRVHYEDSGLVSGLTYGYRLELPQPDGSRIAAGETSLMPLGVRPQLALAGARPNPASADLVIAFTLSDDQRATLDLFDVRGRRIASREVGTLGPGGHLLRMAPAGKVSPGLYFARLTHSAQTLTARITVVQ